jgi:protein dithiol:quinone oxidoreductase
VLSSISARTAYAAIAAVSFGLIGFGLVLQHGMDLQPCPLCIFQRFAYIALGTFATIGALLAPRATARAAGVLMLFAALTGGGIAAWQVWLQMHPESLSCGPGLSTMLESFPLTEVLPKVFRGSGDCAEAAWVFLGLSIAGWSLVWFSILSVASIAALFRPHTGR